MRGDLAALARALLASLELDHDFDLVDVCRVVLTPRHVEVTVFERDAAGAVPIVAGEPARVVYRFDALGREVSREPLP